MCVEAAGPDLINILCLYHSSETVLSKLPGIAELKEKSCLQLPAFLQPGLSTPYLDPLRFAGT